MQKVDKERIIENHLRHYNTYLIGICNCQKQLDYIAPTLVSGFSATGEKSLFYISNNTERVALDRIESKRALDLREKIDEYRLITDSIERAFKELKPIEQDFVKLRYFDCEPVAYVKKHLGYSEDKYI